MWLTNSSHEGQLIFSVDLYVWYLSLCWIIMCTFDSVIHVSLFAFLNTFVFRLRNISRSRRSFVTLVIFKWCFEKLSKSLILNFCSVRIACWRQSLMKWLQETKSRCLKSVALLNDERNDSIHSWQRWKLTTFRFDSDNTFSIQSLIIFEMLMRAFINEVSWYRFFALLWNALNRTVRSDYLSDVLQT